MANRDCSTDFSRRTFLKSVTAAGTITATSEAVRGASTRSVSAPPSVQGAGAAGVRVEGDRIRIESGTLTAELQKGFIVSLKSKATGDEFIRPFDAAQAPALELVYRSDEAVGIDESRFGSIACRQVSNLRAEIVFQSWDGDGVLTVEVDPENGDLIFEPAAYSSRPGVLACRWHMRGLRDDLQLVAPFFQGIKMKLDDQLIRDTRWSWPVSWEAGLAILQSPGGGFWIHTRDDRYRYKALKIGGKNEVNRLALDTEAFGPIDDNLGAGGLAWRVNVFQGDWKAPASQYRDWLWRAYGLRTVEQARKEWVRELALALSWCPGSTEILDAIAHRIDPRRVLVHFPDWRSDAYDENYPSFKPSEQGKAFIAKGQAMGFHIMPHFNSIDMDPTNPVYALVKDFQYREVEKGRLQGWSWYKGRAIGVPESNGNRMGHRNMKVMVKIHPGLSLWRSILGENIRQAVEQLSLAVVFLDVTLNTYNLRNCLVETMTPTEGMRRLIEHVATSGRGLVVGGEGLNEITAQGQSVAQAHLFRSWQASCEGLERTGGCPFNEYLLGRLCRTFGYSGLSGSNEDEELRMRIHEEHGAIPTLTIRSARDITDPNPVVKRVLERAARG